MFFLIFLAFGALHFHVTIPLKKASQNCLFFGLSAEIRLWGMFWPREASNTVLAHHLGGAASMRQSYDEENLPLLALSIVLSNMLSKWFHNRTFCALALGLDFGASFGPEKS